MSRMHEWRSFVDDDDDRWIVDMTFLLSSWGCVWGTCCDGVEPLGDPADLHGCCSHGAHFADAEDRERVLSHARRLTPTMWARHGEVCEDADVIGAHEDSPEGTTRVVDGVCIFHNPPGFEGGPGCALHLAAAEAGESHVQWKPDVCWQLPLRLDSHEDVNGRTTWILREWERSDWGVTSDEMPWWCVDDARAFPGGGPMVVDTLSDELIGLCGEGVYKQIREVLGVGPVGSGTTTRVALPHPALKSRDLPPT